ncbi:small integral membrane protein 8-like isoform X2 [Branchiostoma floridae x Branchiostoma belcheri]
MYEIRRTLTLADDTETRGKNIFRRGRSLRDSVAKIVYRIKMTTEKSPGDPKPTANTDLKSPSASSKPPSAGSRTPGLSHVQTTTLFRVVNPELFMRPNKIVMAFGLVTITGCIAYIAYLNASQENQRDQLYVNVSSDGTETVQRRRSKWD